MIIERSKLEEAKEQKRVQRVLDSLAILETFEYEMKDGKLVATKVEHEKSNERRLF